MTLIEDRQITIPIQRDRWPEFEDEVVEIPHSEPERVRLPRNKDIISKVVPQNKYNWDHVQFQGGPVRKRKGYALSLWAWIAAFIDGLILTSITCVFIIGFSMIMKSTVSETVFNVHRHSILLKEFAVVYLMAAWLYMITCRTLMSASLGEWACGLRLGQPHERFSTHYIFRVTLRATLILITGMVFLPLLSLIFGRDIPGDITGLKLYSLK